MRGKKKDTIVHIAPGFLSPAVWTSTAAVSGGALAVSLAVANRRLDDRRVVLMGVMGAFVFAAQMVNFPVPLVPGTSGHLGGGFLLGVLLGMPLAVVVMASVLVVQALVFQDGGIDALGANLLIMGILPALAGTGVRRLWQKGGRLADVCTLVGGAVVVLAGATIVLVLLWISGAVAENVGFWQALAVMDGIHLLIGLIEGAASVAVVQYVLKFRREAVFPDVLPQAEGAPA